MFVMIPSMGTWKSSLWLSGSQRKIREQNQIKKSKLLYATVGINIILLSETTLQLQDMTVTVMMLTVDQPMLLTIVRKKFISTTGEILSKKMFGMMFAVLLVA